MPATIDEEGDTNRIAKLSEEIDSLLAQYLELLNQYTNQRTALSETFISLSQNIARANFHSKSGQRYGSDSYDQRMQAIRTVSVTRLKSESSTGTEGAAVYTVLTGNHEKPGHVASENGGSGSTTPHVAGGTNGEETVAADTDGTAEQESSNRNQAGEKESPNGAAKNIAKKDPLLMFGIFSPPELKAAQTNAIGMVEGVIPQLLTIDEEMKDLEIKIRRAKKYRVKEQAREDALELARAKVFIKTALRNDLDEFDTTEHARLMIARRIKIANTVNRALVEGQAEVQALYELRGSATILKTTDEEKDMLAHECHNVCTNNVELLKAYDDEKEELAHFTKNFLIDRTPLPPWGAQIGRLDQPQVIVKAESEDVSEMGLVKMESLADSFQAMQSIKEEDLYVKKDESDEILDESTLEEDIPGFLNDQPKEIVQDQAENQDFLGEQFSPPYQVPVEEFAKIANDDYSVKMQDVRVPVSDGFLGNLSLESPLTKVESDGSEFEL